MRTDLDEDPAVVGMAAILNVPESQVIGWLWKLWSIASKQTVNGWLPHYTLQKVDGVVSRSGFAAALESVAWLHRRPGGIEIPNFGHWLSQGAKRRLQDALRKRLVRKASALEADKIDRPVLSSTVLSSEKSESQEEGEKPCMARGPDPPGDSVTAHTVAAQWCHVLRRTKAGYPADGIEDMAKEFAELIRHGHDPAKLIEEILSPARDLAEYFWQFKNRVTGKNGATNGHRRTGQARRESLRYDPTRDSAKSDGS